MGIHAATDSFDDWPEAAALLGGRFDGHPWGGDGTWAFHLNGIQHAAGDLTADASAAPNPAR